MDKVKFFFIEPESEKPEESCLQPASYIRKSFYVKGKVQRATLYTTGLGVYVPYVNGHEAGNSLLMPGFTNYKKRVQYFTKDVTDYIKDGDNVIAAILGDGWYRGSLGAFSTRAFYGDKIKFAASLEVVTDQGTSWIFTDEETKASQDGPIRGNDLKTFEIVDMTKEMPGWNRTEYDDSKWHFCKEGSYNGEIIPQQGENIAEHEFFSPQIIITPNGEHVLDFGQNLSGHVEFTISGTEGTRVVLEMGETLDEEGNFTIKNLSTVTCEDVKEGMEVPPSVLGQTLVYVLKEGTQKYKSTFLNSGFRYVRLTNWPEEIKSDNFTAIAVYGNLKYSGNFRCSNEKINQLVSNVRWSQKSNFVDVPTDCPTRERAGWTGDVNVFAETACYLSDTRKFLKKWLQDFVQLQKEDGSLPFIVPEIPMFTEGVDMQNLPYSSAGWSDALLNVPLIMYQFYGDQEILQLVYETAKKYVKFNIARAKERHKLHFYKRGKHYSYILDTGYHWGEWLEPGCSMMKDSIKALTFPDAEVATAWFYHSVKQLSQMAEILHKKEEQSTYDGLAQKIKNAYHKEFLRRGNVHSKRQCRFVRPVAMELVDKNQSQKIVKHLQKLCEKNHYKTGTGFLTTYQILQVLTDYGYAETAYQMLKQNECPGWMYEIDKGATTIWENWLGIDGSGVPKDSQNHYAMGASITWLFSRVGGIQPMEPGFSKVRIKPTIVGDLMWAETSYESIHGMISARWERANGRFKLMVSLPENVTGVAVMPDGKEYTVSKTKELECELI